jgi:DNA-directed RNA polymerase subunit RPC12/RpoP
MYRTLELATQAIQGGNLEDGDRLLRIFLKEEGANVPPPVVATAYMWLAETRPQDNAFRLECYRLALQIDPTNAIAAERYSALSMPPAPPVPPVNPNAPYGGGFMGGNTPSQGMPPVNPNPYGGGFVGGNTPSQGMPPVNPNPYGGGFVGGNTPSQGMPPVNPNAPYGGGFVGGNTPSQGMPPVNPNAPYGGGFLGGNTPPAQPPLELRTAPRAVGISGGLNGEASGFFVAHNGIIATTRHAVDTQTSVRVALGDGNVLDGTVVRAFPKLDLAFIRVNVVVRQLLRVNNAPFLMDNTPMIAITFAGEGYRTAKRATKQETAPDWIPTMINAMPNDSGGNPLFTAQDSLLVGMLTRNAFSTNGFFYGLHIASIQRALAHYEGELAQLQGTATVYCPDCGSLSRAPSVGGYYCETCGSTLPIARNMIREPKPQLGAFLYGEGSHLPCIQCGARAGTYVNVAKQVSCVRCGHPQH